MNFSCHYCGIRELCRRPSLRMIYAVDLLYLSVSGCDEFESEKEVSTRYSKRKKTRSIKSLFFKFVKGVKRLSLLFICIGGDRGVKIGYNPI